MLVLLRLAYACLLPRPLGMVWWLTFGPLLDSRNVLELLFWSLKGAVEKKKHVFLFCFATFVCSCGVGTILAVFLFLFLVTPAGSPPRVSCFLSPTTTGGEM